MHCLSYDLATLCTTQSQFTRLLLSVGSFMTLDANRKIFLPETVHKKQKMK